MADQQGQAWEQVLQAARQTQRLILERQGASLETLRSVLLTLLKQVQSLPNDVSWPDNFEGVWPYWEFREKVTGAWPELAMYDAVTGAPVDRDCPPEAIGEGFDDLADIAADIGKALQCEEIDALGACALLRFLANVHWGEHVRSLVQHLNWLIESEQAARGSLEKFEDVLRRVPDREPDEQDRT